MEVTLAALRVLRETAERGTFTAAAAALGYTQSAVSRQIGGLERALGVRLFDRSSDGPRLTREGRLLLRRARTALDEIDGASRELRGLDKGGRVRLGAVPSAGLVLLPQALARLARDRSDLTVTSRIGTTPSLVRGLRSGALDLALVTSRPPHRPLDGESPPLSTVSLGETSLRIAVSTDDPLAGRDEIDPAELVDRPWIVSSSSAAEPQLGVWPGLVGRPRVAHTVDDWGIKLQLVAAGIGITTVPPIVAPAAPPGVSVVPVSNGSTELRRLIVASHPDRHHGVFREVLEVLDDVAIDLADL